ncbi:hypothetical protein SeLEV6574_g00046 [Synchytrium endobioticum]|nr:hypothetical protein SeLEV6574_g00046 [Synchytrium endobioticum]
MREGSSVSANSAGRYDYSRKSSKESRLTMNSVGGYDPYPPSHHRQQQQPTTYPAHLYPNTSTVGLPQYQSLPLGHTFDQTYMHQPYLLPMSQSWTSSNAPHPTNTSIATPPATTQANQFIHPPAYPSQSYRNPYPINAYDMPPALSTRQRMIHNNMSAANMITTTTANRPRLIPSGNTASSEVIDLTGSPSKPGILITQKAASRKRRRDPQPSPPPRNLHQTTVSTGSRPSSHNHRESDASTISSHPQPPPAPLPPCDDDDGHFIVNIDENLTPRYRILKLLGQGTFGKVVEAYDRHTKKNVAIKIIRSVQKYRDASKIEIKVLQAIRSHDPQNTKRCIHLRDVFDYRSHICMVFEVLSQSIFDFLKENKFLPFSMAQIRDFAHQILVAVEFCHSLKLIHTDLKPENLMLETNAFTARPYKRGTGSNGQQVMRRELHNTMLRLIDFGSAIFEDDYHSSIVSTRHYRAPEIILNMGWSYPCDIWSIGCILVEFFTGEAFFQTHDNLEHLAMMEQTLGKFHPDFIAKVPHSYKYFKNGKLDWPNQDVNKSSRAFVRKLSPLDVTIKPISIPAYKHFLDLVQRMLIYDPCRRITAKEALQHPFFTEELRL